MLIDHAKPKRVRVLWVRDRPFAAADHHIAFGRVVIAHDAFDQRAFAGAVFAEQRVKCARADFERDVVQCHEIAEPHRHGDGVDAKGACRQRHLADDHDYAPIRSAELATAPNTPPCILIIFSA